LDDDHFDYITKFLKEIPVRLIRQAESLFWEPKIIKRRYSFVKMEYWVTSFVFEENRFTYKGQKTVFSGTVLQHLCLLATVSGVPGNNVGS
jgi:hypothetical protein